MQFTEIKKWSKFFVLKMSLGSIENLNFFDENLRIQKIIFQIARCEADDDVGSWSQMHYSIA